MKCCIDAEDIDAIDADKGEEATLLIICIKKGDVATECSTPLF